MLSAACAAVLLACGGLFGCTSHADLDGSTSPSLTPSSPGSETGEPAGPAPVGQAQREGDHEGRPEVREQFSVSLTKKEFGQFVPIAGIAFGAISNLALVDKIAAAANDAYRERLLVEKSGGELSRVGGVTVEHVAVEDGISLIEILEDEDALPVLELNVATPTDGES
jgi:hypothetical protein